MFVSSLIARIDSIQSEACRISDPGAQQLHGPTTYPRVSTAIGHRSCPQHSVSYCSGICGQQLENSAGYPTFKGQVLNGEQLWELIEGLEANDLLYYTHLLTGYIGSVSFLNTVLKVVDKLRSVNPKLTYVCDPVMGDEGKLYVPPELVAVYREKVVPVASMLTPNQFEAEQLTGSSITSEKDGQEACNILHAAVSVS
ncbi:hypothetical protein HAX54_031623 [Datura stramonium]|uniref:pyridoxal kinase n=1 Tax=Datura stramonium TaxID=4076 RepID=A0ABS8SC10_DATST|nr:hypothetical protein [Datura stramonium]